MELLKQVYISTKEQKTLTQTLLTLSKLYIQGGLFEELLELLGDGYEKVVESEEGMEVGVMYGQVLRQAGEQQAALQVCMGLVEKWTEVFNGGEHPRLYELNGMIGEIMLELGMDIQEAFEYLRRYAAAGEEESRRY